MCNVKLAPPEKAHASQKKNVKVKEELSVENAPRDSESVANSAM